MEVNSTPATNAQPCLRRPRAIPGGDTKPPLHQSRVTNSCIREGAGHDQSSSIDDPPQLRWLAGGLVGALLVCLSAMAGRRHVGRGYHLV